MRDLTHCKAIYAIIASAGAVLQTLSGMAHHDRSVTSMDDDNTPIDATVYREQVAALGRGRHYERGSILMPPPKPPRSLPQKPPRSSQRRQRLVLPPKPPTEPLIV